MGSSACVPGSFSRKRYVHLLRNPWSGAPRLRRAVAGIVSASLLGVMAQTTAPPSRSARPDEVGFTIPNVPPLPVGASVPGRVGVERSAIDLASALGAVVLAPVDPAQPAVACPTDRLTVTWDDPGEGYHIGAVITPVGPIPDDTTTRVNGVVLCRDSHYAYMGFEASWDGSTWTIQAVPAPVEDGEPAGDGTPAVPGPAPAPAPTPAPGSTTKKAPAGAKPSAAVAKSAGSWGAAIEGLA